MPRKLSYLLAALVALTATSAWAADETYPIKLDIPSNVGDVYDMESSIDSAMTTTVTMPGMNMPPQVENTKGQLNGRVEVKAIDKKGEETQVDVTISKMVDGEGHELLKAGQVLHVKRGEKEVSFKIDADMAVPAEAEKLLHEIYDPHSEDAPDNDDVFGTKDKHKVGDSWSMNAEAALKQAAMSEMKLDPKQLVGSTTLKGVQNIGGQQFLQIEAQFNVKDATFPSPDPSMKIDKCNIQASISTVLPVDPAVQKREETQKINIDMQMSGTEAAGMTVAVKGANTKSMKVTPVKK